MTTWQKALEQVVSETGARVLFDEPLARWTSFQIGGPADAIVVVENEEQLAGVRRWTKEQGISLTMLGKGTNVLISDQGLRGVVVHLAGEFTRIQVQKDRREMRVGGGVLLDQVAEVAERSGFAGLEFLAGIPGTIGGGLLTNAGAFGHSLGEYIEQVRVMDEDGGFRVLNRAAIRNDYRSPVISPGLIVVEVVLKEGDEKREGQKIGVAELRQRRRQKHPPEPSAGSFFKNPSKDRPAGALIEDCGLKGLRMGGAKVSERHANFIVNVGGAKFADVYALVQSVKAVVEESTGIELEEEVRILPGFEVEKRR